MKGMDKRFFDPYASKERDYAIDIMIALYPPLNKLTYLDFLIDGNFKKTITAEEVRKEVYRRIEIMMNDIAARKETLGLQVNKKIPKLNTHGPPAILRMNSLRNSGAPSSGITSMAYAAMFTSKPQAVTKYNNITSRSDIEQRILRIQGNLLKYRDLSVSIEDCELEHTPNWYRKPEVQQEFGPELAHAFRAAFSVTPSAGTLEADFGIAGTIATPRRANLGAVIFDMSLVKDELPKPQHFLDIREISASETKTILNKRFTGAAFIKSALLQGVKYSERSVNLDDDTNGEFSASDCDSIDPGISEYETDLDL